MKKPAVGAAGRVLIDEQGRAESHLIDDTMRSVRQAPECGAPMASGKLRGSPSQRDGHDDMDRRRMSWLRLWHDMPTDPKWRAVARASRQPVHAVVSVAVMMLVNASANVGRRGMMARWSDDVAAAALDLDVEQVTAIRQAMQGRVLDGDQWSSWDTRQPERNDDSRDRVRRHREARRNASVTPDVATVTRGNGLDQDQDQDRDSESVASSASISDSARAIAGGRALSGLNISALATIEVATASEQVHAEIPPRTRLRIAQQLGIKNADPIVDAFVYWQLGQPAAQRSRSIAAHFRSVAAQLYADLSPAERQRCGRASDDPDEIKPRAVTATPELRAALARAGGRP